MSGNDDIQTTIMLHALADNQRHGVQAVCEARGTANALIIERI